jgi:RHS repeat-associated protein
MFLFHGQFRDIETGWDNYGYRYYLPQIESWPTRDLIGEWDSNDLYQFCSNCAINRVDYLGLYGGQITCKATGNSKIETSDDWSSWVAYATTGGGYPITQTTKCKCEEKCFDCYGNYLFSAWPTEYSFTSKVTGGSIPSEFKMGPLKDALKEIAQEPMDEKNAHPEADCAIACSAKIS